MAAEPDDSAEARVHALITRILGLVQECRTILPELEPDPERLPGLQVTDHGQELDRLAQEDLIGAHIAQRRAGAPSRPALQHPLVHASDRLRRQAALRGDALHRRHPASTDRVLTLAHQTDRVKKLPPSAMPRGAYRFW
jgi:hypothetical protein